MPQRNPRNVEKDCINWPHENVNPGVLKDYGRKNLGCAEEEICGADAGGKGAPVVCRHTPSVYGGAPAYDEFGSGLQTWRQSIQG